MKKKTRFDGNYATYMPLYNLSGLKSSITPLFGGDLKLDYHHYYLEPTSELDLYANHMSRNIIFTVNDVMYYLNGNTYHQQDDAVHVEVSQLYQKVERINKLFKIDTISFIPLKDNVELHHVTFTNLSAEDMTLDVVTATPIYARSADNLRDHRHVTGLLNQIKVKSEGILVQPTLSFDERGHKLNNYTYSFFAYSNDLKINRYITNIDDFLNGGTFNFPKGIYQTNTQIRNGYEAMGAIGFEKRILKPNEKIELTFSLGIFQDETLAIKTHQKYQDKQSVLSALDEVDAYFTKENKKLQFELISDDVSFLLKWVKLQPILRRNFGNSYLPHHDYGKGGRGWRDLWQDLLTLIMFNDDSTTDLLINNFKGIRIDGSNATIIGDKPGAFLADRNHIVRVWSDHGAWPLLTMQSYIQETGHIDILFEKVTYFDDKFTHYTKETKTEVDQSNNLQLNGHPYLGTILEHLLLQNIVGHLNIGSFGYVRLEDADWNDGLDMAKEHGETVAFTHFYANNLKVLAQLIEHTTTDIIIFKALSDLIFNQITLENYFDRVRYFNESVIQVDKTLLANQLMKMYTSRINHLNQNAWIGESHLQSYINNDQRYLDQANTANLTGQAMALLNQTITHKQAKQLAHAIKKLLFNPSVGGYHLNSDYKKVLTNMGRAFGFSYNHKENGAIFSHMVIMYIYGLYQYDLVSLGSEGYQALVNQSIHKDSHTFLGIPEYFTDKGEGKYLYLTGSASWLLKLLRDEIFGIKFNLGKLYLRPKLTKNEFINGKASIQTYIDKKLVKITYHNPNNLEYGQYSIKNMTSNGQPFDITKDKLKGDLEVYLDAL